MRIEDARAEVPHLGLERSHSLGREHARQHAAVLAVLGRVLEDEEPLRPVDAGADVLEDVGLAADQPLVVDEGLLDVVGAAQPVEVVLLVVIERCLVAEPLEQRIGIHIELDLVRIPIEVGRLADGHALAPVPLRSAASRTALMIPW